ncbi:polyphenol oxidase, chloroplastic-like [Musa acuminata AAA Group]|uniref:polyphenol oxidase, chloroplastic-like n=1 Tax=Musa acuminata AAA Group TaxID=214697 RepID=UPI0031DC41A2
MALQLNSSFTGASSACLLHRERSRRLNVPVVTCRQGNNDDRSDAARQQKSPSLLDRRDMLLGLGGLYGLTAGPKVLAKPIMPPDLSKCHDAKAPALDNHCCPPYNPSETISEYGFPATPLRVRRPAHLVKDDQEYLDKYKEAVRRMKNLPADHPWNYYQQANVHCQYCNYAYYQQNTDDVPVQVHFSWIFLPWHRYYLHFYERILGKLIDDDTFTIPFWNWDTKDGMTFPAIFHEESSPLSDTKRDQRHVKDGKIVDLKYAYTENPASNSEIIRENLCFIQKTFKHSLSLAELFMGDPVRAGEKEIQQANGQLEAIHNAVHMWVGEPCGYKENMGDFSTAARDSVFFSHHSNVDRLWEIYRNLRGNRIEFEDNDWLDSTFLFYDENEKLVKVKMGDCLNPTKLRYTFEQVPLPWLGKINCQKTTETKSKSTTEMSLTRVGEFGTTPKALDASNPLRVIVARPKKNRKKKEKQEKVEVLQINDIKVTTNETARFDVYVTVPYGDLAGPDYGEFVGSYVRLAHRMKGSEGTEVQGPKKKGKLKLGITPLLEDIDAEDADKLVVTLVLRTGSVTVGGVSINLLQTDSTAAI